MAFFIHSVLLDQALAHCPKFPTAAFRKSLSLVSVLVWLIILSDQLKINGLVSFYLNTNNLILYKLILKQTNFFLNIWNLFTMNFFNF